MVSLFKEKSAFDIPDLKQSSIEKLIKSATQGDNKNYMVPPQTLTQITDSGYTIPGCAVVITQLLRVFDELGSHPMPVYKALVIMLSCLKCNYRDKFIPVARSLVPEIQTVLYLSFGEIHPMLRDEIHLMAAAIYDFLMYDVPLPDIEDFSRARRVTHRPAPPPEEYENVQPVTFEETEAPPPPPPPTPPKEEESDIELEFDPRARPPPPPEPVYVPPPPPPVEEILDVKQPEPEPEPEPEPPKEEIIKTEKDLLVIGELRKITKVQYDEAIDSC